MRRAFPSLDAWPLALLVFCSAIGPLPFGLVGFVLQSAGRSTVGWAGLGVLFAGAFTWWMQRFTAPVLGSGFVGTTWALAGAAFFLAGGGISLHLWLEVLRVSEYPITPSWVIAAFTLSAVAYAARMGPENLLRLAAPMALVLAITVSIVMALAWGLGDSGHLSGGSNLLLPDGRVPACWPLLLFASHGSVLLLVFGKYAHGALRWPATLASVVAAVLLACAYVLPIVVWNVAPALKAEFPLLHSITPVSTIFFPVHRLALLAFVPLQLNLLVQLASYVLAAMELVGRRIFPLASGPAVVLCSMTILVLAVWPAPSFTVAHLAALWSLAGLLLFLAVPLVARCHAPARAPA